MDEVSKLPLEQIDVSRAELFLHDTWQPWFARLRKEAPVHFLPDSLNGPFWSVTTHDLIKEVDTNAEVFSSARGGTAIVDVEDVEGQQTGHSFINMDEPEHMRDRSAVAPTVAPNNLKQLESLIRERAVDILENIPVGETFNWVQEVSIELTARMLATLLDFPYEDRRKLIYWSDLVTNVPQVSGDFDVDMEHRNTEIEKAAEALNRLWMDKSGQPPAFDLISMLQHNADTANIIEDPARFLGTLVLLIVGGNDTTRNSISGGVIALDKYPDQYRKLRDNHRLIPNMVAEMIRWQTPVIHMRRTALEDYELGGQQIREGDKVVMWYLSGNRDERVFEDADKLIVDRPNARAHVSFGFGIHRCMGNRLAEMQLRVLWEEIVQRFHTIEVVGDVERVSNNFIRGIKDVPVQVHPVR